MFIGLVFACLVLIMSACIIAHSIQEGFKHLAERYDDTQRDWMDFERRKL